VFIVRLEGGVTMGKEETSFVIEQLDGFIENKRALGSINLKCRRLHAPGIIIAKVFNIEPSYHRRIRCALRNCVGLLDWGPGKPFIEPYQMLWLGQYRFLPNATLILRRGSGLLLSLQVPPRSNSIIEAVSNTKASTLETFLVTFVAPRFCPVANDSTLHAVVTTLRLRRLRHRHLAEGGSLP
jgi:hypothetical protein